MAAILADGNFRCMQESHWQQTSIGSGNGLVPKSDKPLPEPRLTQFTDAYMQHYGEMS